MKKQFRFFQPIDEAIFKGMDGIRSNPKYQQIMNQLESLPDTQLKLINQAISYSLVLLPFLILLILFFIRSSAVGEYEMYKDLYERVQTMKSDKDMVKSLSNRNIASYSLADKGAFEKRVGVALSSNGINPSNISVREFESSENGSVIQADATLNFRNFSSKNLTDMLMSLMGTQKMKIQALETRLNEKESTLSGTLKLVHFGKK